MTGAPPPPCVNPRGVDPHGVDPHGLDPHGVDPHGAGRSSEGDGITVSGDAHCRLRAPAAGRGMPDEVPDVPAHLPLDADRVLRPEGAPGACGREESHVMPCDRGLTGQAASCDHSGTRADPHRRGP
ncbi:hypothetical protein [Streptomyces sp. NPDC102282]|uniref:hypothetical protein n=1 Tax=Streptomyces sp. NPDC102282 TaxID=3366154 RepID=UPI00382564A3